MLNYARTACLALLALLVSALSLPAFAYDEGYLPLDAKVLSHRVPQKLLVDGLQSGHAINAGQTKIEISQDDMLKAGGVDVNGKPWTFTSSACSGMASVWSADLDKNGNEDLVILMYTGGCGWTPNCQLLVLMFEKDGRPFPWAADGYFQSDKHGVRDLVDLDNNGHAELIRQSRDDGYWITSMYEASCNRWHRLSKHDGHNLPLYTPFSPLPNHEAVTPPACRHPFEADLSNDFTACVESNLENVDWTAEDPHLSFANGKHAQPVSSYGSMAVVLDEAAGRRMALMSDPHAAHKLIDEIISRHIPVSTSSALLHNHKADLSCELLFAHTAPVVPEPPRAATDVHQHSSEVHPATNDNHGAWVHGHRLAHSH
jgi:hypothetical protein